MGAKVLTSVKDGDKAVIVGVEGFGTIRPNLDEITPEMLTKCAIYGLNTKVLRSAAGCTPEESYAAICETWENIKAGKWADRVAGAGKIALSKVKEVLDTMSDSEKAKALEALKKLGYAV